MGGRPPGWFVPPKPSSQGALCSLGLCCGWCGHWRRRLTFQSRWREPWDMDRPVRWQLGGPGGGGAGDLAPGVPVRFWPNLAFRERPSGAAPHPHPGREPPHRPVLPPASACLGLPGPRSPRIRPGCQLAGRLQPGAWGGEKEPQSRAGPGGVRGCKPAPSSTRADPAARAPRPLGESDPDPHVRGQRPSGVRPLRTPRTRRGARLHSPELGRTSRLGSGARRPQRSPRSAERQKRPPMTPGPRAAVSARSGRGGRCQPQTRPRPSRSPRADAIRSPPPPRTPVARRSRGAWKCSTPISVKIRRKNRK